jgi:hypothetical protein
MLGVYFYHSYQKLKKVKTKENEFLHRQIKVEKHQKNQLKTAQNLALETDMKVSTIKIILFNLNYTLKELF